MHVRPAIALLLPLLFALPLPLQARTYYYDDANRLVQVSYPDGKGVRYTYDAADNLTSVAPITVPVAPGELEAVRDSLTTAKLQWVDRDGSESGYLVQRRTAVGNRWETVATLPPDSTSFDDSALSASENYVYRVVATAPAGNSAYSNAAAASGAGGETFEIGLFQPATGAAAPRFRLVFPSESGRTYALEASPDLSPGSWSPISFATTANGAASASTAAGTGEPVTVYIDQPPGEGLFYRVTRSE